MPILKRGDGASPKHSELTEKATTEAEEPALVEAPRDSSHLDGAKVVVEIAPDPGSETRILLCLILGLVVLCVGLLKHAGEHARRAKP